MARGNPYSENVQNHFVKIDKCLPTSIFRTAKENAKLLVRKEHIRAPACHLTHGEKKLQNAAKTTLRFEKLKDYSLRQKKENK